MTNSLPNRALLEISGTDRKKFLQGLITNDINKASHDKLIYAVMQNAQGRFLYDFFIFEKDEKLFLDCPTSRRDEIFQKLNFYKLRAQVVIKKNDELLVAQSLKNIDFADPRSSKMGYRIYATKEKLIEISQDLLSTESYNFLRIANKIAEGEDDLTYEKSFIIEFGFDDLNAIDYQKGCYVGQEMTARTHYLGEVRKKVFHVKIDQMEKPEKNMEITCEGKSVGIILSSIFHQNELHALALIKLAESQDKLELNHQKISIVS